MELTYKQNPVKKKMGCVIKAIMNGPYTTETLVRSVLKMEV